MRAAGLLFPVLLAVPAAGERVLLRPQGTAELRVTLSRAEIKANAVLLVKADPNQVEVTVLGRDGRSYSSVDTPPGAVVISLGDERSSSHDEINLAAYLGSNATLITWTDAAAAGTYRVQLSGKALEKPISVETERTTADRLERRADQLAERQMREVLASVFLVPEKRTPLRAGVPFWLEARSWPKDSEVLVGSTLGRALDVTVIMPDGTKITAGTAQGAGCQWWWSSEDWVPVLSVPTPHLTVKCPTHLAGKRIGVQWNTQESGLRGELAVAVSSDSHAAASETDDDWSAFLNQAFLLRERPAGPRQPGGITVAWPDRVTEIQVEVTGGQTKPVSVEMSAQPYRYRGHGPRFVGPDNSKVALGPAVAVNQSGDGTFRYPFTPTEEGVIQVDFIATGKLANGRRFRAEAAVSVSVPAVVATATGLRQQRVDRDGDGRFEQIRFLVDLEVKTASRYRVCIGLARGATEDATVCQTVKLAPGSHRVAIEGAEWAIPTFARSSEEPLRLEIKDVALESGNREGFVRLRLTAPQAGVFEAVRQ